jgi:uncharacterized protein
MDTYPVNLTSILDDLGATIEVSDYFELDKIVVGDETFVVQEPPEFSIWLTHTGTSVVSGGYVTAHVVGTCSRCLCDFRFRIKGEVDGFYVEPGQEDGIPEDQDYELVDSAGVVDILPSLMVALVLESPFAPIHDPECAGLCSSCGEDLNLGPCGCTETPADDHPFSALGALLSQDDAPRDV